MFSGQTGEVSLTHAGPWFPVIAQYRGTVSTDLVSSWEWQILQTLHGHVWTLSHSHLVNKVDFGSHINPHSDHSPDSSIHAWEQRENQRLFKHFQKVYYYYRHKISAIWQTVSSCVTNESHACVSQNNQERLYPEGTLFNILTCLYSRAKSSLKALWFKHTP